MKFSATQRHALAEDRGTVVNIETSPLFGGGMDLQVYPEHKCHYTNEVRLSDCPSGCKIYRCTHCPGETLIHNPVYGGQHS